MTSIAQSWGIHPDQFWLYEKDPEQAEDEDRDLLRTDPPEHRDLRNLASHAFVPKIVADLESRITELTTELLDAVQGQCEFDLIDLPGLSAAAHRRHRAAGDPRRRPEAVRELDDRHGRGHG